MSNSLIDRYTKLLNRLLGFKSHSKLDVALADKIKANIRLIADIIEELKAQHRQAIDHDEKQFKLMLQFVARTQKKLDEKNKNSVAYTPVAPKPIPTHDFLIDSDDTLKQLEAALSRYVDSLLTPFQGQPAPFQRNDFKFSVQKPTPGRSIFKQQPTLYRVTISFPNQEIAERFIQYLVSEGLINKLLMDDMILKSNQKNGHPVFEIEANIKHRS